MFQQISKTSDESVSLKEWTSYILKSRNNSTEQYFDNNILHDLLQDFKKEDHAEISSNNVNIHDTNILNEVQLRHALKIANSIEDNSKVRKLSGMEDLNDLDLKT